MDAPMPSAHFQLHFSSLFQGGRGLARRIRAGGGVKDARIGVVGATGAVGTVTLRLLRERGYRNVRAFASSRSAGTQVDGITVEEATPEVLAGSDLDVCLFSIGTAVSRLSV